MLRSLILFLLLLQEERGGLGGVGGGGVLFPYPFYSLDIMKIRGLTTKMFPHVPINLLEPPNISLLRLILPSQNPSITR
jgi:hypothetical protein